MPLTGHLDKIPLAIASQFTPASIIAFKVCCAPTVSAKLHLLSHYTNPGSRVNFEEHSLVLQPLRDSTFVATDKYSRMNQNSVFLAQHPACTELCQADMLLRLSTSKRQEHRIFTMAQRIHPFSHT